ncbi:integrin alpha N-terminal domain-containing protein [Dendrothele bispora CBS 962.96]|uniref:Integrin alpha N-terminal domain-containing protein n=1 Tax=Dendrothele bispora (strain CBS 962.96) TaxID=1314807 RepID=A0A4S8M353_DENBC|nr:integrin alpha N-terminal domain-containing protein [Dendrothele bispora CBS 962.96]
MMHRGRCRVATLCLLSFLSQVYAIWPFAPKRISGKGLVSAGAMGLTGSDRVIAYGDFNGDQFLDVLMLGEDRRTLTVFLWNHEDFQFQKSTTFRHPGDVYNVVPGDFTHSGKLDLLIMSKSQTTGFLDLRVYPALPGDGFDTTKSFSITASSLSQPIPLDIDGDMKIDLFGMTPSSQSSTKSTFQNWHNVWNATQPDSPLFSVTEPPFHGAQCTLSNPHSNAVVDLNGDCLADVFLVCDGGNGVKSYQIWINNKDQGFKLEREGPLPSGVQSISFADVDRDGTIDIVFPTCNSISSSGVGSDCSINIVYNQQLSLCSSQDIQPGRQQRCRSPEDLCVADPNFQFDFSSDNNGFVWIPISSILPQSPVPSLLVQDTTFPPAIPLSIKLGDVNLDGFPDLFFIVSTPQGNVPKLVYSVPCGRGVPGCAADGSGRRGWQIAGTKGTESLEAVKDARGVAFIDMDEDGTLDMMIQRTGASGADKVLFVQNNFYYDAFFLKAIVLNGACNNGWCYAEDGTKYHPFGVSYSGATYKYTVLDTSGRRSAAQVGQLPQTSYHSLQSPYSFFGLGRTNNYIENLFVGSTMHIKNHYINMEGVIPNSKVVILPSTTEGDAWKRELFLRPGEWIPWVTLTVIAGTVILAIMVFVLHLNEKREDELERRRASHRINFDAL